MVLGNWEFSPGFSDILMHYRHHEPVAEALEQFNFTSISSVTSYCDLTANSKMQIFTTHHSIFNIYA